MKNSKKESNAKFCTGEETWWDEINDLSDMPDDGYEAMN